MNEPYIPHTSAFACDDIARETVGKTYGWDNSRAAADRIRDKIIGPVCSQIVFGGKVRQGQLGRIMRGLEKLLADQPTVVAVDARYRRNSALSTKENARMTFILALGDEEKRDWIDFLTGEVVMTRTAFELNQTLLDFRIHRHALSRFMQRERKPAEEIMADMMGALQMASLFGNVALAYTESPHCAVPIGDGMLFGNLLAYQHEKKSDHPILHSMRAERKQGKPTINEDIRPEHLISGGRAVVEAITYVGDKQLTPAREKLRDVLRDFRARHALAIANLFERHYYRNALLTLPVDALTVAVNEAIAEAKEIVTGCEWQAYTRWVGTGPNG